MTFIRMTVIAAVAALVVAPAGAQTADSLKTDAVATAAALTQGVACKWLTAYDRVALEGKVADNIGRLAADFGKGAAEGAADAAKAAPAAAPCGSADDKRKEQETTVIRFEWLVRAETLLTAANAESYSSGMTTLAFTQASHAREYQRLRTAFVSSFGMDKWNEYLESIKGESETAIALACSERRTFMTTAPRGCPDVPAEVKKYIPVAVAQLKSVEAFSQSFANAFRPPAAAPPQ